MPLVAAMVEGERLWSVSGTETGPGSPMRRLADGLLVRRHPRWQLGRPEQALRQAAHRPIRLRSQRATGAPFRPVTPTRPNRHHDADHHLGEVLPNGLECRLRITVIRHQDQAITTPFGHIAVEADGQGDIGLLFFDAPHPGAHRPPRAWAPCRCACSAPPCHRPCRPTPRPPCARSCPPSPACSRPATAAWPPCRAPACTAWCPTPTMTCSKSNPPPCSTPSATWSRPCASPLRQAAEPAEAAEPAGHQAPCIRRSRSASSSCAASISRSTARRSTLASSGSKRPVSGVSTASMPRWYSDQISAP